MIPLGFDPRLMPCVPRTLRVQKPRKIHKIITTTKVSPRGRLSSQTILISEPVSPVVPKPVPKIAPVVPKIDPVVPKIDPVIPKIDPVVPKIAPVVPKPVPGITPSDTDEDYEFVDLDLELAEETVE
jgi:hypothetical protein